MLNVSKGNMYPFVTHTWNAIKGKCPHDCLYCYMKVFKQRELRLDMSELKVNLGKGHIIFVGSSTDMWAEEIPDEWIKEVLRYCRGYDDNKYLFQTKNPKRFEQYYHIFPSNVLLACTIETNRVYPDIMGKAPNTWRRRNVMMGCHLPKMISVEPVLDFDLERFIEWIEMIKPLFVSIGADSKGHGLPEPTAGKLELFIERVSRTTEIVSKKNLERIL